MREIAEFFPGVDYHRVASFIWHMRSTMTKHIHIQSYTMEGHGRRYPRPVYALGHRRDAPKPKPITASQFGRRYRKRFKAPQAASSVFTWRPDA